MILGPAIQQIIVRLAMEQLTLSPNYANTIFLELNTEIKNNIFLDFYDVCNILWTRSSFILLATYIESDNNSKLDWQNSKNVAQPYLEHIMLMISNCDASINKDTY